MMIEAYQGTCTRSLFLTSQRRIFDDILSLSNPLKAFNPPLRALTSSRQIQSARACMELKPFVKLSKVLKLTYEFSPQQNNFSRKTPNVPFPEPSFEFIMQRQIGNLI